MENYKNSLYLAKLIKICIIATLMISNIQVFALPETKINASDATAGDGFGIQVSISGDYAIIGAYADDEGSGSAYMFVRDGEGWSQQAKLTADDGAADDNFGYSVDIDDNHVIVGALYDDDSGDQSGSAYIFVRNGNEWTQQAKLIADDATANSCFGSRVSITGNYAVVTAHINDNGRGAAYVFMLEGEEWTQQAKLVASDAASGDRFGNSAVINENYIIVGAYWDDDNGGDSGSAYIFARNGEDWTQQVKLVPDDNAAGDYFGGTVSISGDIAAVQASYDDDGGNNTGSVYIFVFNGESWIQQEKITASDAEAGDLFGGVSIDGDNLVVGVNRNDDNGENSGSVYIYSRNGNEWTEQTKLTASDAAAGDYFGTGVYINNNDIIVGAPGSDDDGDGSGSAYIYQHRLSNPILRQKYSLIGIPGTVDDGDANGLFQDDFGGAAPGHPRWRVSRWNDPDQWYERYNEGDHQNIADFAPGLGFWVVQAVVDNCVLDIEADHLTDFVPEDTRFEVPLSPGRSPRSYTQVANPFSYAYDLSNTYFSIDGGAAITVGAATGGGYINGNAATWDADNEQYNYIAWDESIDPWTGFWVIQTDHTVDIDILFTPDGFVEEAPPRRDFADGAPPFDSPPASEGGWISAISSASEGGWISAISSASEGGWVSAISSPSERGGISAISTTSEGEGFSHITHASERGGVLTNPSANLMTRDDYDDWALELPVMTVDEEYRDVYNKAGIKASADECYDAYDAFEFTPMNDAYVHLYFPHSDWDFQPANYSYDYRSTDFDGAKVWDFTIKIVNLPNREFVLRWDNIGDIHYHYFFRLEDTEGNRICDMRETEELTFRSGDSNNQELHYRLVVEYHPEGVDERLASVPDRFGIVTAYPNPFNSEIRIGFNLASAGIASLKVFDLQGREVTVIRQRDFSSGSHQLMWDASRLGSGVYIVKLDAGSELSTKKVVLMR